MDETKMNKVGIFLGILGGAIAILESGMVLAYSSGGVGLVGLVVAILTVAGVIVFNKGRRLLGATIMFLSTLIGQITGGIIGFILIAPSPIFNERFGVSGWTLFGLVGSILILFTIWRSRGQLNILGAEE